MALFHPLFMNCSKVFAKQVDLQNRVSGGLPYFFFQKLRLQRKIFFSLEFPFAFQPHFKAQFTV